MKNYKLIKLDDNLGCGGTNMIFLITICIIYSLLALTCVYAILSKHINKKFLIIPIFMELIVICSLYFNNVALFGIGGLLGLLPLYYKKKGGFKI